MRWHRILLVAAHVSVLFAGAVAVLWLDKIFIDPVILRMTPTDRTVFAIENLVLLLGILGAITISLVRRRNPRPR